jgi:hypothetical protein
VWSECDSAMLWRREPGLGKLRKVETRCIDSGVGLLYVANPSMIKKIWIVEVRALDMGGV